MSLAAVVDFERERKKEREEKENLSSLKICARVFFTRRRTFPTVMQICAIGSSGPSGAPSTPILIYFTLLYFTSYNYYCVFKNEEIKISCVFVDVLFFLLVSFFFDCLFWFIFVFWFIFDATNVKNQIPSTSRQKNFAHCPPLFLFHNQRTTPQISIYRVF